MNTAPLIYPDFIIPKAHECQRLFHGRGHCYEGLEHVCIDWYFPVVLITLYSKVEEFWLTTMIAKIRSTIVDCRSIQVQHRYKRAAPVEVVWGESIGKLVVQEHQQKYHINLSDNQNHGLFLDMANGRSWVIKQSHNKRVLNLFAYTCAFSVCAIAGGAEYVMNLDMAKSALSQGRENHKLNGHELSRIKYAGVDLFKSWGKLRREQAFDLLICDPPSFQKGSVNIERDYKKIIKRIPEFMSRGSDLLLCLNSPDLDQSFIQNQVKEFCPDCVFVSQIENPSVYEDIEQGKGLKVLHFRYEPSSL